MRGVAVTLVAIANVCRSAPAGTAIVTGIVTSELRAKSAKAIPPDGALPVRSIVPVDDCPPGTDEGSSTSLFGTGARSLRAAPTVLPAIPTVTRMSVLTGIVVAAKVTDDAPGATVTTAGTDRAAELDVRDSGRPMLAGATPSRLTLPLIAVPPTTLEGEIVIDLTDAGLTVTVALA